MKLNLYTTRNQVSGECEPTIFPAYNNEQAYYQCRELVRRSYMQDNLNDVWLRELALIGIGTFDTETGMITAWEPEFFWYAPALAMYEDLIMDDVDKKIEEAISPKGGENV